MEREALRAQTTELLQRLRGEDVPQALFELLGVIISRLDRIELGGFGTEEETPTRPDRKQSSGQILATHLPSSPAGKDTLSGRIAEIFTEAKPKKDGE
jgi:hypothetical protein